MTEGLHVVIASVGNTLFDGFARAVTVPTTAGVITVLAKHEPLVAVIQKGTVEVHVGNEKREFAVTHGVLEVQGSRATLLL